jgi:DUF3088 family protein
MSRDQLYLLKPDFFGNGKGPYFCPGCAQMVGLLDFYAALKQRLGVEYVDFPNPRPELAALLGEENQSCPVLVLKTVPTGLPPNLKVQNANDHAFVEGANEMRNTWLTSTELGFPTDVDDRQAILEIIHETKLNLPEYWRR